MRVHLCADLTKVVNPALLLLWAHDSGCWVFILKYSLTLHMISCLSTWGILEFAFHAFKLSLFSWVLLLSIFASAVGGNVTSPWTFHLKTAHKSKVSCWYGNPISLFCNIKNWETNSHSSVPYWLFLFPLTLHRSLLQMVTRSQSVGVPSL